MSGPYDNGGAAFPRPFGTDYAPGPANSNFDEEGMSLRDWFAGQALAGHLASLNPGTWGNDLHGANDAAKGAYLVADAMLKARKRIYDTD